MNILAFDTGTETMSIAVGRLRDGQWQVWEHEAAGGANASTYLIPTVLDLLRQAQLRLQDLQAIAFGCGPGSFTGLRTACAVAQGLAAGAQVPVLPVDSLLAVAEDARAQALAGQTSGTITAVLDARMDEVYAARYAFDANAFDTTQAAAPDNTSTIPLWRTLQEAALLAPEAVPLPLLVSSDEPAVLAGNALAAYGARVAAHTQAANGVQHIAARPRANAMLRLTPQLLAAGKAVPAELALPHYVRDKVAKTTEERMQEKAHAHPH